MSPDLGRQQPSELTLVPRADRLAKIRL